MIELTSSDAAPAHPGNLAQPPPGNGSLTSRHGRLTPQPVSKLQKHQPRYVSIGVDDRPIREAKDAASEAMNTTSPILNGCLRHRTRYNEHKPGRSVKTAPTPKPLDNLRTRDG